MAKLYIFGIGGTGARVLRSFTMMMAAVTTQHPLAHEWFLRKTAS